MAVENLKVTELTNLDATPASPIDVGVNGGRVRYVRSTLEVTAAASVNSTYEMARIPSNARLTSLCVLHHDDLASTGSPVIDLGVFNLEGESGITDDDDCLIDGTDVASAAASVNFPAAITDVGKRLWEFVASQTEDPHAMLSIKATIKTAATNTGGTLTLELFYAVD